MREKRYGMYKNGFLGALILLLLVTAGCKEYTLPTGQTDPVFFVQGNFDGNAVDLKAGEGSLYMYTEYEKQNNGIFRFFGSLSNPGCDTCRGLTISINDYRVRDNENSISIDSILRVDEYAFLTQYQSFESAMTLLFSPLVQGSTPIEYAWDFGKGQTSTLKNPVQTFYGNQNGPVCLTIKDANGCTSSVCNHLAVDSANNKCNSTFSFSYFSGLQVKFVPDAQQAGNEYFWDFGDSMTSTAKTPYHIYNQPGQYEVCLTVVNTMNNCITAYCRVISVPVQDYCAAGFDYGILNDSNLFAYDKIWLEYKLAKDKVYSSKGPSGQPGMSYFEITDIGDYKNNEKGQPTKIFELNFDCYLYNIHDQTDSIRFKNGKAHWSIAYPL